MNAQEIFIAAIEMDDLSLRAAYVQEACKGNSPLQRDVEDLLAAHDKSGDFLDIPALEQIAAADSAHPPNHRSGSSEVEIFLPFLQPSSRPGSLGRLLHYDVKEVVGRGGCGIVLKAFDHKLHRVVAIKAMLPELATTSPARKRFLREARATAAIRHDNVVNIYAVEEKPLPFLVMEYIDGQTLQDKIQDTGPLSVEEVVQIGHGIALGLAAAHAQGVIHRDIKPANILLERGTGRPKITDFGLARSADDASLTRSGAISGTPLYMSPEQAQGKAVDYLTDLFSLGSVFYVMCSGRPPFRASTALAVLKRVVEEEPRPIPEILSDVPDWLVALIVRLHAKEPQERLSSAKDVARLLNAGRQNADARLPQDDQTVDIASAASARSRSTAEKGLSPVSDDSRWSRLMLGRLRWVGGLFLALATLWTIIHFASGGRTAGLTSVQSDALDFVPQLATDASHVPRSPPPPVDPIIGHWRVWNDTLKIALNTDLRAAGQGTTTIPPEMIEDLKRRNLPLPPKNPVSSYWVNVGDGRYRLTHENGATFEITLVGDHFQVKDEKIHGVRQVEAAFLGASLSDGETPASQLLIPDRKAADYVLAMGGTVQADGIRQDIKTPQDLPNIPFRLTAFSLQDNSKIRPVGLENMKGTIHLRAINLNSASRIDDTTLEYFKDNSQLARLDLAYTQISGTGFKHLRGCPSVTILWLNSAPLTDEGLAEIAQMKKLSLLGLPGCTVSDAGMRHFANHPNLRQVELHQSRVTDEFLKIVPSWPKIGRLNLDGTHVTDQGLQFLQASTTLNELVLANTAVSDEGLGKLTELTRLHSLDLTRTKVSSQGVADLSQSLRNCRITWSGGVVEPSVDVNSRAALYVFSVGGLVKINNGAEFLAGKEQLPKSPFVATAVALRGCKTVTDEGMKVFGACTGVTVLDISNTPLTNQGLSHFEQCRNLRFLECDQSKITGSVLPRFANHHQLDSLGLWGVPLNSTDLRPLADQTFRHLNLGATAVTDETLLQFQKLNDLEYLNLRYTSVGDLGLAQFQRCNKIVYLSLGKTRLTDVGLGYFRRCRQLEHVNLSETIVTDAGVEFLKDCPNLKELHLAQTKVSAAGMEALRQALPQCKIFVDDNALKPTP